MNIHIKLEPRIYDIFKPPFLIFFKFTVTVSVLILVSFFVRIFFIVRIIKHTKTNTKKTINCHTILKYSKGTLFYKECRKQSKEYPNVFAGLPVAYVASLKAPGISKLKVVITCNT